MALLVLIALPSSGRADFSTALTDKIYQGSGTIDLLKDTSSAQLQQYISQNGMLMLGIDVNENASGNEQAKSEGIALKKFELTVVTTQGTFTFSNFSTSTTAAIQEKGATIPQQFYTAFGQAGSSAITSSTTGFNLAPYDDVITLSGISLQGQILSASLNVQFVNTAAVRGDNNESFFDYSGGFEDFALLSMQDAITLETAQIGVADAPASVTYTSVTTALPVLQPAPSEDTTNGSLPATSFPPAAPALPLVMLIGLDALLIFGCKCDA